MFGIKSPDLYDSVHLFGKSPSKETLLETTEMH